MKYIEWITLYSFRTAILGFFIATCTFWWLPQVADLAALFGMAGLVFGFFGTLWQITF
jgi:hypothetical protein